MENLEPATAESLEPSGDERPDLDTIITNSMSADEGQEAAETLSGDTTEPQAEDITAEQVETPQEQPEPEGSEPLEAAPQHWPREYQDAFAKAPPEIQGAWKNQVQTLLGEARKAKTANAEYDRLFTPEWQQHYEAKGHQNAASFMGELLHMYQSASADPGQFIQLQASLKGQTPQQYLQELAGYVGVNFSANGEQQQAEANEYVDPEIQQVRQHTDQNFAALNQKIAALGDVLTTQRQQAVDSALQKFVGATDDQGNPKHVHFEAVQSRIADLLMNDPQIAALKQSDMAGALAQAYEAAIWADPQTRTQLIAAEKEAERKAAEAERAQRAKSSFASTNPAQPVQSKRTLDDIIAAQMGTAGA